MRQRIEMMHRRAAFRCDKTMIIHEIITAHQMAVKLSIAIDARASHAQCLIEIYRP